MAQDPEKWFHSIMNKLFHSSKSTPSSSRFSFLFFYLLLIIDFFHPKPENIITTIFLFIYKYICNELVVHRDREDNDNYYEATNGLIHRLF